jgi:hypothetical protein
MKPDRFIRIVHIVRRDVAISVVIALSFIAIVFMKLIKDPTFASSPTRVAALKYGPYAASGIILVGFACGMFRARSLRLFEVPPKTPEPSRLGKKF